MRFAAVPGLQHRQRGLHPAKEIALHPVGAGQIQFRRAIVLEPADARVFEETPDDGDDADVLGYDREPGTNRAHAAHDEIDLDAVRAMRGTGLRWFAGLPAR